MVRAREDQVGLGFGVADRLIHRARARANDRVALAKM